MKTLRYHLIVLAFATLFYQPARAEVPRVGIVKDIAYFEGKDADLQKHKLDLYLPKEKKDFPVLLYVHGGGWSEGDRSLWGQIGEICVTHGIGAVVISYRLSPKFKPPVQVQDVARAFAWTQRNISKYGGRADQIFLCGHSAGGHLVALLATDES